MSPDLPAGVTVEFANSLDADDIADLWVELAADQRRHGSNLLPDANRTRVHETMLKHVVTNTALVARHDDDVVGFVTFGQESERFQQDVTRGIVHNIYVEEDHRGKGIGTALLRTAEETLVDRGVDTLGLQAMAANDAAREFYRRHGYEPHQVEFEKSAESDSLTTDD
ncbi:GNAT family N-acetyltransferase [Natronomonas salina]|uniref:GNAT family N-acetyltransferase n=1 Tax=Natronomonas salina TaxID=1710540 RepID=UPI0015B408FA|nr:GNAT family N-acetyltransferase [Natronomonas salina]QLD91121.1 GNAT family N-acetyltransferase [Natronomonas salina]